MEISAINSKRPCKISSRDDTETNISRKVEKLSLQPSSGSNDVLEISFGKLSPHCEYQLVPREAITIDRIGSPLPIFVSGRLINEERNAARLPKRT